jgi:enhancer of yellow 2 transcription factor
LQDDLRNKLVASGERDRLVGLLKERLVECGWKEELKQHCREVMKERARKGNDTRNVEGVTREVITHAQKSVPDSVKTEFLAKVRQFILKKN